MGRSPGDGDKVVTFYLLEKGVDAADVTLVRNWSDRAGGRELDAVSLPEMRL